ncbi:MAG: chloride channel protein [Gammaproteobacteria bacterium]|nr:chloride channel protein [Gammaproteobacteria bacterium]
MRSFHDLPYLVLVGITIGILAVLFTRLIQSIFRFAPRTVGLRMLIAGLVTGIVALAVPQVLGQGYDTVNQALAGELTLAILIAVCVFKIMVSATTIAFGVPVGAIGPLLVIGATAGGVLGTLGASAFPETASSPAFYVMMGMGAMMGAALQAPLAALMAVMELTHNVNIILPAMLVIIVANITSSHVFGMRSIFIMQMETMGLEFRQNPLSMALNRASVASIMNRSFDRVEAVIDRERAKAALSEKPTWLLVHREKRRPRFILRAEDLKRFLEEHPEASQIDLGEIPATRKDVTAVLLQATLSEALEALNAKGVQAVYVNRISAPMIDSVIGIVTREDIESYYRQ